MATWHTMRARGSPTNLGGVGAVPTVYRVHDCGVVADGRRRDAPPPYAVTGVAVTGASHQHQQQPNVVYLQQQRPRGGDNDARNAFFASESNGNSRREYDTDESDVESDRGDEGHYDDDDDGETDDAPDDSQRALVPYQSRRRRRRKKKPRCSRTTPLCLTFSVLFALTFLAGYVFVIEVFVNRNRVSRGGGANAAGAGGDDDAAAAARDARHVAVARGREEDKEKVQPLYYILQPVMDGRSHRDDSAAVRAGYPRSHDGMV